MGVFTYFFIKKLSVRTIGWAKTGSEVVCVKNNTIIQEINSVLCSQNSKATFIPLCMFITLHSSYKSVRKMWALIRGKRERADESTHHQFTKDMNSLKMILLVIKEMPNIRKMLATVDNKPEKWNNVIDGIRNW